MTTTSALLQILLCARLVQARHPGQCFQGQEHLWGCSVYGAAAAKHSLKVVAGLSPAPRRTEFGTDYGASDPASHSHSFRR